MTRRRVAVLNFHPAFSPPKSGGELRYVNLMTRLSRRFDVHLVNPTFGDAQREEFHHTETCIETRIPKSRHYNAWHHFFDKHAGFSECSGLVSTLAVRRHAEYLSAAREVCESADVVIHSSPFAYHAWPAKRIKSHQYFVYDSYNVEAKLAREVFGHGFWANRAVARIGRIEGELCQRADLILACSREDAEEFQDLYGVDGSKIAVVPNGADLDAIRPADDQQRRAARRALQLEDSRPAFLFIGSGHPPNVEALKFLLRDVVSELPEVEFLFAGRVCEFIAEAPSNIRLLGLVSDETRAHLFAGCDVALNPMFSGSGTNLKMLEFLAAGLPVVTTPVGARGLQIAGGEHAVVVPPKYFLKALTDLLSDRRRLDKLGSAARSHAEVHFSWDTIGESLCDLIELKMNPRVLMLNDYPMTPATSGGKIRLEALGHQLAGSGQKVTLLTLAKERYGRHFLHAPNFEELNVRRSDLHNMVDRGLAQPGDIAVDDVTAAALPRLTAGFSRALKRESRNASAVLLNHCYMSTRARRLARRIPLIYESHNVESFLKRDLYSGGFLGKRLRHAAENAERTALSLASAVTCVSEEDRRVFIDEFAADPNAIDVAENGVRCPAEEPVAMADRPRLRRLIGLGKETTVLFLGSGHPPNADAARFILENLSRDCPDVTFLLVGSVCGWFPHDHTPENVVLMGEIGSDAKAFLLQAVDVALNPVRQGAGSSLKVPEYLAAGLPVISTEIGARGFLRDAANVIRVCQREKFTDELQMLARDGDLRQSLSTKGRRLAVEKYDWSVTLKPLLRTVERLVSEQNPVSTASQSSDQVAVHGGSSQ